MIFAGICRLMIFSKIVMGHCKSAQSGANSNAKARSIACSRIRLLMLDRRSTGDFVLVVVLVLETLRRAVENEDESRFNAANNPIVKNQPRLLVVRVRSRRFLR